MSKTALRALVACMLTALVAAVLIGTQAPDRASALSGSDFQAGNIISDANFYNGNALSQAAIQSFLQSQVSCTSSNCLANYRTNTASQPADAMCNAYQGASGELASTVIFKVQQACGISAKVLIVTLQKEQGLITNPSPTAGQLNIAMGYACPDTSACDTTYYGVFNQLYHAAWQLKRYGNPAGTSNFFNWYPVGSPSAIQWNPNSGCGSSQVTVQNAATAALYYYTPYQPNAAALNNLYGVGDGCSSYGNRNFWVYYNQWFGSPTAPVDPLASLDYADIQVGPTADYFGLSGWVIDRSNPASTVQVDIYLDQPNGTTRGLSIQANQPRPDVGAVYPSAGPNHGFGTTIQLTAPGSYRACLFPHTGGTTSLLGCKTVIARAANPLGSFDVAQADQSKGTPGIAVSGWAFDGSVNSYSAPVTITATPQSGGSAITSTLTANISRPDVGAAYPGMGNNHGFASIIPITKADSYSVCASTTASSAFGKVDKALGCRTVVMGASAPFGTTDYLTSSVQNGQTIISIKGWAIDAAWPASTFPVDVYVDKPDGTSSGTRLTANASRPDVGKVYPNAGPNHGFQMTVPATRTGTYRACAYAIGSSPFGNATVALPCRTITITGTSPIGFVDSLTVTPGANNTSTVTVRGWTADAGAPTTPLEVNVYLDRPSGGTLGFSSTANVARPDVGAAYPVYGPNHGYAVTMPVTVSGQYRACVYAQPGTPMGGASALGCATVTVQ